MLTMGVILTINGYAKSVTASQEGFDMTMTDTSNVGASARAVRRPRGRPKALKTTEGGNRVHVSIPDALANRLLEIQRDTHASSLTEVVKAALQLYAAAVAEHKAGGHVYLKRKDDGVERQLALFI